MPIPRFSDIFTEVLQTLEREPMLHRRELQDRVVALMDLTPDEKMRTMSRGGNVARSRVHWAQEFLCQAGAVDRPKRGYTAITDFGRELLREPLPVTIQRLRETEGLKEWKRRSQEKAALRRLENSGGTPDIDEDSSDDSRTPEERIQASLADLEDSVADELLRRIKHESPDFLEQAVLQLLHKMGYGSSEDDLEHLGGAGDGGVDGVINQDALGLDQIYIQAKRYSQGTIGRPDIQGFVGALAGKHASRGIFITTSDFSRDAREYAANLKETRVILIDGEGLARLMIRHKVGVTTARVFEVPEIDENFFGDSDY